MTFKETGAQALINMTVFFFLVVTGALLYAGVLRAPFVLDDFVLLNDPHLLLTEITPAGLAGLSRITTENVSPRLAPNLTFALNYYFGRRDVAGYHLFNLLIHIVTAGLVFLVGRRALIPDRRGSALIPGLAALLWLANPLHVQSVTYTWQRMNSMGALFVMLTLYFYIRGRETGQSPRPHKTAVSGAFFAAGFIAGLLALASKQTAAILPALLVLYEWFFFQDLNPARLKKRAAWLCLAALAAAAATLFFLGASPVKAVMATYADKLFTPGQRLLTEPQIVLFYITLLLFPHPARLNLDYDFPLSTGLFSPAVTALAVAALLFLIAGAAVTAKKNRLLSFAVIWFMTNLLIESSIVGLDLICSYRTYLPSVFPFLALTALMFRIVRYKAAAVIMAAVIVISGLWTCQRNLIWRNDLSLWQDTAAKSPLKARPHHNLGLAYKSRGECDKAAAAHRQALQIRLATAGPDHYRTGETWNNLGAAYDCLGEVDKAIDSYRQAVDVFTRCFGPDHLKTAGVYNNLCVLYGRNENFERAVFWCQKALSIRLAAGNADHPEAADLHNNLGLALAGAGARDEARRHLEAALQIYRRHLGDRHKQTEQCRENLSGMLSQQQSPAQKRSSPTDKP